MGEAKRRKLLDPNYGKTINSVRNLIEVVENGLKIFPVSFCRKYFSFKDSIWEYPDEQSIYAGYPEGIVNYAKGLEHEIKCEFWGYLLFVSRYRTEFNQCLCQISDARILLSSTFVYLYKLLFVSSSIIHLIDDMNLDLDRDIYDIENRVKELGLDSFTLAKWELIIDYCHRVWAAPLF